MFDMNNWSNGVIHRVGKMEEKIVLSGTIKTMTVGRSVYDATGQAVENSYMQGRGLG